MYFAGNGKWFSRDKLQVSPDIALTPFRGQALDAECCGIACNLARDGKGFGAEFLSKQWKDQRNIRAGRSNRLS